MALVNGSFSYIVRLVILSMGKVIYSFLCWFRTESCLWFQSYSYYSSELDCYPTTVIPEWNSSFLHKCLSWKLLSLTLSLLSKNTFSLLTQLRYLCCLHCFINGFPFQIINYMMTVTKFQSYSLHTNDEVMRLSVNACSSHHSYIYRTAIVLAQ